MTGTLAFKRAQLKICHSPEVKDVDEKLFFTSLTHILRHFDLISNLRSKTKGLVL